MDSRTIIKISPEPVTKISASLSEETLLVSGGQLVLNYPLILLALLALHVAVIYFLRRLWLAFHRT